MDSVNKEPSAAPNGKTDSNIRLSLPENIPIMSGSSDYEHTFPWKQYLAAFLASLVSMATGCVGGWSSPAVPALASESSYVLGGLRPLDPSEISWIASLNNLGAFMGSIPAGALSFSWGRRNFLLTLAVPLIVGWLMIIYNFNVVWLLYLGRFLCGVSYGCLNVALPIYNNEVCRYDVRGRIGIFYDLMQCFGVLWVYWLGAVTDLYWCTMMCLAVPVVFFVTFIWMPESPTYLVRNGKKDRAIESIKWLHGKNCNVQKELNKIHLALQEGKDVDKPKKTGNGVSESRWSLISSYQRVRGSISKVTVKAVTIAFFMFVLQRTCGGTLVIYFTEPMLRLAQSSISPSYATVANGIAQLAFSILSIFFIDNVGRRPLLLLTFFVMTITLIIFTVYITFVTNGSIYVLETFGWWPTVSLCLFVGMFRLGVSPIPWFMAPEIIPTEAQKWAPSMIVCSTWGISFLLTRTFLPAIEAFGQPVVYSVLSTICLIGVVYTWLVVPETRNKSREEIQIELGAKKTYYDNS